MQTNLIKCLYQKSSGLTPCTPAPSCPGHGKLRNVPHFGCRACNFGKLASHFYLGVYFLQNSTNDCRFPMFLFSNVQLQMFHGQNSHQDQLLIGCIYPSSSNIGPTSTEKVTDLLQLSATNYSQVLFYMFTCLNGRFTESDATLNMACCTCPNPYGSIG